MTELSQKRIEFMNHLHEAFVIREGHGAMAFVSVVEVKELFDNYLDSNQSADTIINQFVRSVLDSNV